MASQDNNPDAKKSLVLNAFVMMCKFGEYS